MIDFSPLHKTLKDKNMVISDMRNTLLHPRTIAKINKNKDVNLSTIESICIHLNVPIEKVVKIKLQETDTN